METQPSFERRKILAQRDGQTSEGFIERRELLSSERLARGAKVGGALWGVAFLTVFIPVLHFILPPLFLLLGIIFGWAAWHDKAEIARGEFACPSCKAVNTLEKQSESFPKSLRCTSCHLSLEVTRA